LFLLFVDGGSNYIGLNLHIDRIDIVYFTLRPDLSCANSILIHCHVFGVGL